MRLRILATILLSAFTMFAASSEGKNPSSSSQPELLVEATRCLVKWAVQDLPMPSYNGSFEKQQTKDFEPPHIYLIYCPFLPRTIKLIDDPRVRRLTNPPKSTEQRDGVVILDVQLVSSTPAAVVLSLASLTESFYAEYRFSRQDDQLTVTAGRK